MKYQLIIVLLAFGLLGCTPSSETETTTEASTSPAEETAFGEAPHWSKEAIWYQIFVERFRNGDPTNDPRPVDMQGAVTEVIPATWSVTPWGHDWYELDPWYSELPDSDFYRGVQLRRYGGDLQGVLDKIDYIDSLGVTAIYFNPVNDAPSLHKYDARHYRHIDRNFGPDPDRDVAIMAAETPDDPATWQWTSADSLFLELVDALHERDIRVILDYSWNHTGQTFWALADVQQNGANSRFVDWYSVESFDDPTTAENEFEYEGWFGIKALPVLREDVITQPIAEEPERLQPIEGNLHSESLKQHIFNVSKRWLDPNGDGDPSDGIDGFRLDVAGEMTLGFWRDYREFVRSVKPDAYLVGEIWWELYPDNLLDPKPYLEGDVFDAVMNYRWYRLARGLFAQSIPTATPSQFAAKWDSMTSNLTAGNIQAMMNVSGTHDSPRLATSFANKTKYKFEAGPRGNPDYHIGKPGAETLERMRLFFLHQFTFPGGPHIWNGDEVGMWGGDDPDNRKPVVWSDLEYQPEATHYYPDRDRASEAVAPDLALYQYIAQLANYRQAHPVLATGEVEFLLTDDANRLFAYRRYNEGGDEIITIFNLSDTNQTATVGTLHEGTYRDGLEPRLTVETQSGTLTLTLPPLSGRTLVFQKE